jgi:hypothetical protein
MHTPRWLPLRPCPIRLVGVMHAAGLMSLGKDTHPSSGVDGSAMLLVCPVTIANMPKPHAESHTAIICKQLAAAMVAKGQKPREFDLGDIDEDSMHRVSVSLDCTHFSAARRTLADCIVSLANLFVQSASSDVFCGMWEGIGGWDESWGSVVGEGNCRCPFELGGCWGGKVGVGRWGKVGIGVLCRSPFRIPSRLHKPSSSCWIRKHV